DDEASSGGAVTWNRFAAPPADEPEQNLLLQERSGQLKEAMEQLTPRERDVILSLYFERKSIDETANAFHCTRQAVSKVKRKALGKLRRRLRRAVM
ncbi:MAG: sigma-70 family RNA polymerase sigma factor, partial [Acidaminococcaceae bacterium]|nr:sigma-70 family RNA polymerase sigma factor [Acidaminococcaceae bacterium]